MSKDPYMARPAATYEQNLNEYEYELLQELAKLDEVLVEQKVTAILGDCCSYEGENEYDIGHKVGKKNFLKVQ